MENIDEQIRRLFGEHADQAILVLSKENAKRQTGKEVDISNEGYDAKNQLEYYRPSKEKIAEGDVLGKDGLWHSLDRGLFRVNSRTFLDFFKRKPELLKANGITTWDDMLDPVKSVVFSRILFNEQGWKAWAAAPEEIKSIKPKEDTYRNVAFSLVPTPSPTPTTATRREGYFLTPSATRLLSPDPNQQYIPSFTEKLGRRIKDNSSFIKEKIQGAGQTIKEGIQNFGGPAEYEFGDLTQSFGARNPAEIYSGGINRGTDFAMAVGTPVNLPQGNWKVLETFNRATASGPNNPQRGINQGYGNSVLVQNTATGEKLRLSHLAKVEVRPGQVISGGSVGMSGATGNVQGKTGAHLDVEYFDPSGRLADITKSSVIKKSPTAIENAFVAVNRSIARPAYAADESLTRTKTYSPTSKPPTTQRNYSPAQQTPGQSLQSRNYSQASTPATSGPVSTQAGSTPARNYTPAQNFSSNPSLAIQRGNTLSGIATSRNTTVARLMQLNPQIKNPNLIFAGASLRLQ